MGEEGGSKIKWLALGAVIVLGGGTLMFVTKAPPPRPTPAPQPPAQPAPAQPTPEEPPQPEVTVEQPPEPEQAPQQDEEVGKVDLFAGASDDLIVGAHERLLDGRQLGATMTKQLYDYGQAHPDDPLPQLLMAHDGMKQKRYGIAVRLYRMAWQADPAAKHDPKMLGDLVYVAATHDKIEHREAVSVLKMIYGNEALEEIDRSLASARAAARPRLIERLEKTRAAMLE